MFKPTQEEIKDAMSGGRPVFKEDEEVSFTVTEVEERKADDGSAIYIVKTVINNTENTGKKYSIWCRVANKGGRGTLMAMLGCFITPEQMLAGVNPAMILQGKIMKCTPKFNNGYANWYDWKADGGTPDIGGATVQAAPVQAPAQPAAPQQSAFDSTNIPF